MPALVKPIAIGASVPAGAAPQNTGGGPGVAQTAADRLAAWTANLNANYPGWQQLDPTFSPTPDANGVITAPVAGGGSQSLTLGQPSWIPQTALADYSSPVYTSTAGDVTTAYQIVNGALIPLGNQTVTHNSGGGGFLGGIGNTISGAVQGISDTVSHVGQVVANDPLLSTAITAIAAVNGIDPATTAAVLGANKAGQAGDIGAGLQTGLVSYGVGSGVNSLTGPTTAATGATAGTAADTGVTLGGATTSGTGLTAGSGTTGLTAGGGSGLTAGSTLGSSAATDAAASSLAPTIGATASPWSANSLLNSFGQNALTNAEMQAILTGKIDPTKAVIGGATGTIGSAISSSVAPILTDTLPSWAIPYASNAAGATGIAALTGQPIDKALGNSLLGTFVNTNIASPIANLTGSGFVGGLAGAWINGKLTNALSGTGSGSGSGSPAPTTPVGALTAAAQPYNPGVAYDPMALGKHEQKVYGADSVFRQGLTA
jgi:hypothetical protein